MKKLVLAATVAALATSANAATIYEGKGLTFKLDGVINIQYRKDDGVDTNSDLKFDDLEIRNFVSYDLGNDMTAFARLDYSFDGYGNDNSSQSGKLEEAHVGFSFGDTKVLAGEDALPTDSFGIETGMELAGSDAFPIDSSNDMIALYTEVAGIEVGVGYDIPAQASGDDVNDKAFDLYVSGGFDAVTLGAGYQSYTAAGAESKDTWGLSVAFDAGMADLGVDYSSQDDVKSVSNLSAAFAVAETTTITVGYVDTDNEATADFSEYYANVAYKFPAAKNVKLFAEIADSDAESHDAGYVTGMEVKF